MDWGEAVVTRCQGDLSCVVESSHHALPAANAAIAARNEEMVIESPVFRLPTQRDTAEPRRVPVLVPVSVARAVLGHIIDRPEIGDVADPNTTEIPTPYGLIGIRSYRPGVSDPAEAWADDLDWAVLLLCPPHGEPEAYIMPARHFLMDAPDAALQHVDYNSPDEPGVYWIDLDESSWRSRHHQLTEYRLV